MQPPAVLAPRAAWRPRGDFDDPRHQAFRPRGSDGHSRRCMGGNPVPGFYSNVAPYSGEGKPSPPARGYGMRLGMGRHTPLITETSEPQWDAHYERTKVRRGAPKSASRCEKSAS